MKKCSRCQEIQDDSSFYFYKDKPVSRCKKCIKEERKSYYEKNNVRVKDRRSIYYNNNRDIILEKDRAYKKTPKAIEKRISRYKENIDRHRENDRKRYKDAWLKRRLSQIKSQCKKNGIFFDLSEEWFEEKLSLQNNRCYWSGVEFDMNSILFRPSFDRIEPGGPYSKDNVVISTYFINFGRNNASIDELMKMIDDIRSIAR